MSGAIGRQLASLLVADGGKSSVLTRSIDKVPLLRDLGVEPVAVDIFDAVSLQSIVTACHPEIVIHQLTDLSYALEASKMTEALRRNARLRGEGTRNLVEAAV